VTGSRDRVEQQLYLNANAIRMEIGMGKKTSQWTSNLIMLAALMPAMAWSQSHESSEASDPGPRRGPVNGQQGASASNPLPLASVSANSPNGVLAFFQNGLARFQEQEVVSGGRNNGLGPRFNLNSCSGCHAQPAVGGSSAPSNPQFALISSGVVNGASNTLPSFVLPHGPTLVARFPFFTQSNGTPDTSAPDGGVQTLFTVTGLPGAGHCTLQQPNFAQEQSNHNIIYRIPTPTFGAGLIENLDDAALMSVQRSVAGNSVGISGAFNHNGNDGTISRFGWKAQNKSLLLFAGEAYNVEMGITNEIFPQERPLPQDEQQGIGLPSNCLNLSGAGYPEDATNFTVSANASAAAANAQVPSDIVLFAEFMRLLAPPVPSNDVPGGEAQVGEGSTLFVDIGCAMCHTPAIHATQASNVTSSLAGATVNAYSDFELHHMGVGLADNVSQGSAGGDQFRSAPLWGLGQRLYFMHDGRASNLVEAIHAHQSNGSEATQVEQNFTTLTASQQQAVLVFLRSL
jgi:CxxC motif-containing protein (DUF1111 family)